MKVVIAIDSLKNSLTSVEAGRAVEAGVRKAYGSQPVQIVVKPLADGGEGTVEALVEGMNGELRSARRSGALRKRCFLFLRIFARYGNGGHRNGRRGRSRLSAGRAAQSSLYDDLRCRPGHSESH